MLVKTRIGGLGCQNESQNNLGGQGTEQKDLANQHRGPYNPRAALEIIPKSAQQTKQKGQSVGEDYARGIQIFRRLFVQYGHPELANSLPDFPQGSTSDQNVTTSATAPGSSQQLSTGILPSNRTETRMEEDQEDSPIIVDPNDEPMTDDNFILSDGGTPAQDEPEAGISQMDAADIESELDNLLTIDDSVQYPPLVADPSANPGTAVTLSIPDPQPNQNNK